jgi:hypothetical protein
MQKSFVAACQGDQMRFTKKIAKTVHSPTQSLSKLLNNLDRGEKQTNNVGYFGHFQKTAQSKQSPNGRKFAQSDNPAARLTRKKFFKNGNSKLELKIWD